LSVCAVAAEVARQLQFAAVGGHNGVRDAQDHAGGVLVAPVVQPHYGTNSQEKASSGTPGPWSRMRMRMRMRMTIYVTERQTEISARRYLQYDY
jgi:hypothetical protein